MIARVERKFFFEASHRLWVSALADAENAALFGRKAGRFGHGHNYEGSLTVAGPIDAHTELVINIADLDRAIRDVVGELDHKFLNQDVAFFAAHNPTCEWVGAYLFERLGRTVATERVELHEDSSTFVEYFGEEAAMTLTRRFSFSAAHRLESRGLSSEENMRIFGKCNNPYGHGHNYELEVTVEGRPDPVTGLVVPLGVIDAVVNREIIDPMDCRHLNEEVPEFRQMNPTSENLAVVIWNRLAGKLPAVINRIRLWETRKSCFEYRGE